MGDASKHIEIAKEKLQGTITAYNNKQNTIVGDLAIKVIEQLVEADAFSQGKHFGDHPSRHNFSNKNYPKEINDAMRKVWFAYGDLGYDGVNGKNKASFNYKHEDCLIRFLTIDKFSKRFQIE